MPEQVPQNANEIRTRSMAVSVAQRQDGQTEFEISFSSEEPCRIWGDTEVLSHEQGAMRVGERQQTLALLFNHNRNDLIGAVSNVHIDTKSRKGRCNIRFAETQRGQEMLKLFETEMLSNVSVSYRVFRYEYDKETKVFTATDWEPLEISLVTVPADPTVGKGRSLEKPDDLGINEGEETMPETNPAVQNQTQNQNQAREAAEAERARISSIMTLCRNHDVAEMQMNDFINNGTTLENARAAVLDIIQSRQTQAPTIQQRQNDDLNIDMSQYSLSRAILASTTHDWSNAQYERQVSDQIARDLNRTTEGIYIPFNVIARDMTTATTGALVPTDHRDDLFIEPLRKKTIVGRLGAVFLTGLQGNVSIPRQMTTSQLNWITEGSEDTVQNKATFDNLVLKPHMVIGLTRISKQLLTQSSPAIEQLLRDDFLKAMAIAIDEAALSGTGTDGQPEGILNNDKVQVLEGGTNGAELTYDHIIDLETLVNEADADGASMAYATNAKIVGQMKKLKDQSGDRVWYTSEGGTSGTPGQVNGYAVGTSNLIPSDLTKGTAAKKCSAMIFGDFSQLCIGQWGAVEVTANPYETKSFNSGSISLRILNMVDVGIRQPKAFAVMKDILNTPATGV